MMNSSREMMNEISIDEMIPGITSGRVISRNVDQRLSPRSSAASSSDRSSPANADVQDRDRERRTDQRVSGDHRQRRQSAAQAQSMTVRSETATMISGRTSGSMMKPMIGALARKRVARPSARGTDAEERCQNRRADRDQGATSARRCAVRVTVASSRNQRVVKPDSGKGDDLAVVEGEDRQQNDRRVEEDQVRERVDAKAAHGRPLTASRDRRMSASEIRPTAAIASTASVAPSGALLRRRNWVWIMFAIISPSGPPTSRGVT